MAETERRTKNQWLSSEPSSTVEINGHDLFIAEPMITRINGSEFCAPQRQKDNDACNLKLGIGEKTLSAAGAAFLSAIIVNPLDVVKMFADLRCSPSCTRAGVHGTVAICPPDCFQYKGTLDVFNKIIRQVGVAIALGNVLQEGFSRLWRGTNAGLALAVPTVGIYLPCYDIFRNWMEGLAAEHIPIGTPYVPLVAGSSARSIACATCYPIELARTRMQAVKDTQIQKKPPGVFSTLLGVLSNVKGTNPQNSCMLISTVPVSGFFFNN
ncbi:mitochondrial carrier protein MTM1-like isoform X3 [Gossypium australe]|uniref:Mitochondrial carrier protein MTM1-like isoform X3 n=1 Tax=Gossypium australe TaxID=47621 RepID=A0A5B6VMV2_9ROSI|nr:mitochondrial carrier protein MTM1-like isoform X3 [Gossypium australe]